MRSRDFLKKEFYQKYRWFYTSSGKLVVGGKNSKSNDSLLNSLKQSEDNFLIMHTEEPGSPFAVLLCDESRLTKKDKEECAIFTACFGKSWKAGKKKAVVHSFLLSSVYKAEGLAEGTWSVRNVNEEFNVPLQLALTKQQGLLRAVPPQSVKNKSDFYLIITPGTHEKNTLLPKLKMLLGSKYRQDELLSALPAGGITIRKPL